MDNLNQTNQSPQQPQQVNPIPPAAPAPVEEQPPNPPDGGDWLKWVLIIVVVALLSSTTTYLVLQSQNQTQQSQISPTPTPDLYREPTGSAATANWKTYTSTKYGYSLKYPLTLKIKEYDPPNQYVEVCQAQGYCESPKITIRATTKDLYTAGKNLSLKEIAMADYTRNQQGEQKPYFPPNKMLTPLSLTTFAGIPAHSYTMCDNGFNGEWQGWFLGVGNCSVHKVLELEHGSHIYIIYYDDDPILEKILSTFKFLE